MAIPKGETVMTYGDMKQTWKVLDETPQDISEEDWKYIGELVAERSQIWARELLLEMESYPSQCLNPIAYAMSQSRLSPGWCMPSREGRFTEGVPIEEDSIFAPREVDVIRT